jgi:hypothetical protein
VRKGSSRFRGLCRLAATFALVATPTATELAAQGSLATDPTLGLLVRGGDGPVATLAVGVVGSYPVRPHLHLRAEGLRYFQGLESCEAEFPESHRCASSPLSGVIGVSMRRPGDTWALRLDTGAGVHIEDSDFGGTAPVLQLGAGIERGFGRAWAVEATFSWTRTFNDTWEDRLGEPLQYALFGIGLRRGWDRR